MKRMQFSLFNGTKSRNIETTMERAMQIAREDVLGGDSYIRLSVKCGEKYILLGTYFPASDPERYKKTYPDLAIVDAEPVLPNIVDSGRFDGTSCSE